MAVKVTGTMPVVGSHAPAEALGVTVQQHGTGTVKLLHVERARPSRQVASTTISPPHGQKSGKFERSTVVDQLPTSGAVVCHETVCLLVLQVIVPDTVESGSHPDPSMLTKVMFPDASWVKVTLVIVHI